MPDRRRSAAVFFGLLLALPLAAQQPGPPETGGVAHLDFLLQHLAETRRVLVIGAHPDDEDTELITWASRHFGAEAAYLSVTRGDGGQNLIGDELGVALGLLRTRELEAARAVDGGQQFFTRAYDFGFTRSLQETERFWPPDSILKDVVRVIRRFRPHVIVTVFAGTPRDGHGQHQYSGVMARRGYDVAGDPNAFPELRLDEGLDPWTPSRFFGSARFTRTDATLVIEGGVMDHRLGKTIHQIAMESRSQHRSQDFGALQDIGPSEIRLVLLDDGVQGGSSGLFAGVPLEATWVTDLADSLRRHAAPATLPAVARRLATALAAPGASDRERGQLEAALVVAAGLQIDVRATRALLATSDSLAGTIEVYGDGEHRETPFACASACGAAATEPYFLRTRLEGALYDWRRVAPGVPGFASDPPTAWTAEVSVGGRQVRATREVTERVRDQAIGELREPVRVVPRVGVALDPDLWIWPAGDTAGRTFTVTLTHFGSDSTRGSVVLESAGWNLPPAQPFAFTMRGQRATVMFTVRRPPTARGAVRLRAVAITSDGERLDRTVRVISYPHIRPIQYLTPAEATVEVAPIALPSVTRVGYVRGAADHVPEVLARVGVPIVMLDPAVLARGDLSRFDVIVIGSRAYETDSSVVRHNDRLLAWVRAGGHLIVQYQQYDFVAGNYAPYPLSISRPHDRITDENAPVTLLAPDHPVFAGPNRMADADWADWPQERGLYFAGSWDDAYVPLLEIQDPDMPPMRGGLLVARYGEGTYIYTGISFFRAIPAGNAGALRLLLNLIDLKAADFVP